MLHTKRQFQDGRQRVLVAAFLDVLGKQLRVFCFHALTDRALTKYVFRDLQWIVHIFYIIIKKKTLNRQSLL
tara:strand:+ start:245 stop:460 length:216 start_codon:yes stop_codon:yes gene_type:complete